MKSLTAFHSTEPRKVKDNFPKRTVKTRSKATFLQTNLGSRSDAAQGQILSKCTTARGLL